jgi:hypothetical protein
MIGFGEKLPSLALTQSSANGRLVGLLGRAGVLAALSHSQA